MDHAFRATRLLVPTPLGAHSPRLAAVRALANPKGRRDSARFIIEGATLLDEARRSGLEIAELYVTQAAFDATPNLRELDRDGLAMYLVDERTAAKISDLQSPPGILAIARSRLFGIAELFGPGGIVLVLADLSDPGNAGTLLRSAEAFGVAGVVFGRLGVDPFHPKVVRGAMGAAFRLPLAVAEPDELAACAAAKGAVILGLAADGAGIDVADIPATCALVVGHERRGLSRWEALCAGRLRIPMAAAPESLNAAVAGSIALYEAARGRSRRATPT